MTPEQIKRIKRRCDEMACDEFDASEDAHAAAMELQEAVMPIIARRLEVVAKREKARAAQS
jgi:hypothetical protein